MDQYDIDGYAWTKIRMKVCMKQELRKMQELKVANDEIISRPNLDKQG